MTVHKRLWFVLVVMSLAACSSQSPGGGGDGGGGGAGVLTPDSTTVVPLQYVTLQDPGANFDASNYKGTLGTGEVVLYRGNATSLSFMVPDQLAPGSYDLKVSGYPAVSFTVQAGTSISDPVASVTGVVTSLVDSLAATKEKIKTDLPEKVVYLDALKANLDELQKQFNALSAEDQMKAAQFLAANSSLLSSKAALGSLGMLKWDWSVLDGDSGQLVMDTAKFAVVGTLFIAAATTTAPVWLTIGLAVATVSVAYRVIDDIAGVSTTRVMDDQSATVEDNSGSTMLKALAGQTIYFAQGVEKLLKAEALFRALGDEDRNSDDPVVKKIFKALDGLNPTWDQASAALPQSLGAVPTLGAGKETTETLKPALFSVNNASVQPNTVHIVTASTAIDGFKITFDGPSGDFTFSMIYVDDNGTVEIPVNGHLGCDPANPKSCPGCCDSNGACRTGDTTDACGKDGQTCMDCSGGSARYEGACHKPEKVCCNVSGSYCNDAPCCSNMCSRVDCCDYIPGTGYFCP